MNNLEALLRLNVALLDKSVRHLKYSYTKVQKIDLCTDLTDENLESTETLTSRFARSADILTQRIIKSLILYLREDAKTFIDRTRLMEKIEIVKSANEIILIRDLRNKISHEYALSDLTELWEEVLTSTPALLDIISRTEIYINKILDNK